MPSLTKAMRELGRGARITRHGGARAGWSFLREEIVRNGWLRVLAALAPPRPGAGVECNLCGWKGRRFLTHVGAAYVDRECFCPRCHSYPRHRGFAWLLRQRLAPELERLAAGERQRLVFAPEPGLIALLSEHLSGLQGVDLRPINEHVVRLEDLQALTLADESVDFVSCFHVLEHVADDRRALAELRRVLHPSGRLALCVPITFGRRETIDLGGPVKSLNDHCFDYGEDFPERLTDARFSGEAYQLLNVVPEAERRRLGMVAELVFWLWPTPDGEDPRIESPLG